MSLDGRMMSLPFPRSDIMNKIFAIVLIGLAVIQISFKNASETATQRFESAANSRMAALEAAMQN